MLLGKHGVHKINRLFWKDKKVFLTGHTGFKGSWLSLWLQDCGAKLMGYALPPKTSPNLFNLGHVSNDMESIIGDIRDLEKLKKAMSDFSPEIVIHMAAQPLVLESYKNPVETYSVNVMGTVNLFESVRNTTSVKASVNVTSDKCYENNERDLGYHEDEPMGGKDPYSSSKGCSELVTAAYHSSYFNETGNASIASARAGNVIGGGDWADDRLVPDILDSIENNNSIVLRNPNATRPWQHVLEPLSGYLILAQHLFESGDKYSGGWNFGPKDQDIKSVSEVAEYLINNWKSSINLTHDNSDQPHEAQLLKLDISKSKALGWKPKWSVEKSLDTIIEWHKAYLGSKNIKNITINQIREFEEEKGLNT